MIDSANTRVTLLTAALCLALSPLSVRAADAELEALEEQAFKQAAALASPSVVKIQTVGGLDRVGEILTGTGATTGVVVDPDGYIISSSFNFISKPASILVTLLDGRRLPATVVASDESKMLTLLKIDATELIPAKAAPKDSIKVGQWSLALGRTYDSPQPSVSVGIVSALNRIWGRAVQTDAKISPVNYGGPLINIKGETIGILVPLSPRGSGETAGVEWYDSGIGFAVPLEDINRVLDRMKAGENLKPGLLGITFPGKGLLAGAPKIDRVRPESPADQAGLEPDDLIVEVDGHPTGRQADVKHALGNKYAGETVQVSYKRGEETKSVEIKLVAELVAYESGFLGMLPIRPGIDDPQQPGVGVRFVYPDSPAAGAGIQVRDRILQFNGTAVNDTAAFADLVSRVRPGEKAKVVFSRDGAEQPAEVELVSIPADIPPELRTSPIPAPPETDQAADDDDEAPRTGRFTEELAEYEHGYWAYVPEGYNPAHQYGLVVWLHPGGDTMEAALIREWRGICEQRGIILLAPKAEKLGGWNLNESEFVKDLVTDFQEKYAIDPARICVHGYADSGNFAAHVTFKYRDLFRAVCIAGAPIRTRPPENDPDYKLQFLFVSGDKDAKHKLVEASVAALRKLKFPVSLIAITGGEQDYPPPETLREIARWLDSLDRI